MGRRNTFLKFTRGSLKTQSLSWALIQAQCDFVQIRLGIAGEVCVLREVLSQEPVGVFVRAALPGTLRIAEVHFHIRGHRKVLVFGHFQSAVPRQRASQGSGEFTNMFTQCCHNLRRISGGYLTRREDLALKQKAAEPNLNDIILQRR